MKINYDELTYEEKVAIAKRSIENAQKDVVYGYQDPNFAARFEMLLLTSDEGTFNGKYNEKEFIQIINSLL